MNILFPWETPTQKIVARAAPLWLPEVAAVGGVEQAISDARHLGHLCYIVDTYNVRPAKNAGGHSRGRGPEALLDGS